MRYPASETAARHERILDAAARLYRDRGFEGVGVAEIMRAAGLTHGAFYAHFPSKAALAAEAVARAQQQSDQWVAGRTRGADDPRRAFLDSYLTADHRDSVGSGCPIAALGPEIARNPAVRAGFTGRLRHTLSAMAKRLAGADAKAAAEPHADAIRLLSTAVGALVLARAVDDPALSDAILAAARDQEAGET